MFILKVGFLVGGCKERKLTVNMFLFSIFSQK